MSQFVNATAQVAFKNNLELLLNQTQPLLWPLIPEAMLEGYEKAKVKDLVGNVKAQKNDTRHGDTKYADTPHDGVWMVKPPEIYYADLVDRSDQVETTIALGSAYMMTAVGTINRGKDDAVLDGIFGSIISGKTGTTVTPFPNGMIVPVNTGSAAAAARMNTKKVRAARKMLQQNFNDMQKKRYMILTAEQSDDLLDEVNATSGDYKESFGARVDANSGRLTQLLGFNIVELEMGNPMLDSSALSVDGNGYRKNPFWVDGGIVKGVWDELTTSIDVLPQKLLSKQVFAGCTVAATRTQAGMTGYILNSED